jgi:hypothetical protein
MEGRAIYRKEKDEKALRSSWLRQPPPLQRLLLSPVRTCHCAVRVLLRGGETRGDGALGGAAARLASSWSRSWDSDAAMASRVGRTAGSGAQQEAASWAKALGVPGGKLGRSCFARRWEMIACLRDGVGQKRESSA